MKIINIKVNSNEELLSYALGYNFVGAFGLDESVIKALLIKNKATTKEDVANILEDYMEKLEN